VRKKPLVLVIDDEPDILTIYQQRLGARGYDVLTAADGSSGLRAARHARPDLILLDVMMPDRSGIDVLSDLRQDARLRRTPVLMLTAKSDPETIRAGKRLGIAGYVLKSTDAARVLERIEELAPPPKAAAEAPPAPAPSQVEGSAPSRAEGPAPSQVEAPAPPPEPPFECAEAMRDLLPEAIAMLQLRGTMRDADAPAAVDAARRRIDRGIKKLILDLTFLKWTFLNAGHLKGVVDEARAAGADVRILAPDPDVRQALLRQRVQAPVHASIKDTLDGF
jgi:CheY-like chemotaxis protein/anti-anti-sigma regulatory factor